MDSTTVPGTVLGAAVQVFGPNGAILSLPGDGLPSAAPSPSSARQKGDGTVGNIAQAFNSVLQARDTPPSPADPSQVFGQVVNTVAGAAPAPVAGVAGRIVSPIGGGLDPTQVPAQVAAVGLNTIPVSLPVPGSALKAAGGLTTTAGGVIGAVAATAGGAPVPAPAQAPAQAAVSTVSGAASPSLIPRAALPTDSILNGTPIGGLSDTVTSILSGTPVGGLTNTVTSAPSNLPAGAVLNTVGGVTSNLPISGAVDAVKGAAGGAMGMGQGAAGGAAGGLPVNVATGAVGGVLATAQGLAAGVPVVGGALYAATGAVGSVAAGLPVGTMLSGGGATPKMAAS